MSETYRINGKTETLTAQQVEETMAALEAKLRGGTFQYVARDSKELMHAQVADIKTAWSPKAQDSLRNIAKGKATAAGIPQPNAVIMAESILEVVSQTCKERIEKDSRFVSESHKKATLVDVALSAAFGVAPSVDVGLFPRNYKILNIIGKIPFRPEKLVFVDDADVPKAKQHVFSYFNQDAKALWLIGWARQEDLLAAPKGNKTSDAANCFWDRMSRYLPIGAIRPMSELLVMANAKVVAEGCLLEKVPSLDDLPIPVLSNPRVFEMGQKIVDPAADFQKMLFGEDKPSESVPTNANKDDF
jgi:hypothetical protein